MTERRIAVTIVNHVERAIAASPDAVWDLIRADYRDAGKFAGLGYAVEQLDLPAAPLGAYRLRLAGDGARDEKIFHITECDNAARRLSLLADYLSEPDAFQVHATYQARARGEGTLYALDCHTRQSISVPNDADGTVVAAAIAAVEADYHLYLVDYLDDVRARAERGA